MLVFGIAFVVALNLAARLDRPEGSITIDGQSLDNVVVDIRLPEPGQAGNVTPIFLTFRDAENQLYEQNLARLQTWSILGVFGLAIASGIGGYVLSGMMLRPVRDITEVAGKISATNLSGRINHEGPDDELKALADTFDSMIDRLERSFEQQRQFVQDASHELRTPLTAIRTNIEVAEMDEMTLDDYRFLLDTVKAQTERLTRLSEDLLLLTTSEGGTPELEPVNLADLGREVITQLSPLAAQRNVTLRGEGAADVEASANGDLLYRCVFNLVDNAIKYSGEGSAVTVTASLSGELAEIAVRDNGAGIPENEVAHIFDRFFRVDKGRSRREGGTGLGLAIVRELVQSMGGTVTVASSPGVGTAFTVRLPADIEAPAPPPKSAQRSALSFPG